MAKTIMIIMLITRMIGGDGNRTHFKFTAMFLLKTIDVFFAISAKKWGCIVVSFSEARASRKMFTLSAHWIFLAVYDAVTVSMSSFLFLTCTCRASLRRLFC